ncbi:MAG: CPBP family intramembrane glutamic endopeptidase [Actinomycetota bacterium]
MIPSTEAPASPVTSDPSPLRRDPALVHYRHPVRFYLLATAIPWALWFGAAYLSRQPDASMAWVSALGLAGLIAPVLVAGWFIGRDPALRRDVAARLVGRGAFTPWIAISAVFLLPASLLLATALSVPLGYDANQFLLREGFSFTAGLVPVWLVLVMAPILEELAWHTYGTDALASRMRVLTATLVFAAVWSLWHLPLGFIEGYYQNEVAEEGVLHTANFVFSILALLVLMNWLYYRSGRSVLVVIVFHLSANFGNELFMTHPDTKLIQTALLLVLAVAVVWHDRQLFLAKPQDRSVGFLPATRSV